MRTDGRTDRSAGAAIPCSFPPSSDGNRDCGALLVGSEQSRGGCEEIPGSTKPGSWPLAEKYVLGEHHGPTRGGRQPHGPISTRKRNPLSQKSGAGLLALTRKNASLRRGEPNGMLCVSHSGFLVVFCPGFAIAGLTEERVSLPHHLAGLFKYLQSVFGTPC